MSDKSHKKNKSDQLPQKRFWFTKALLHTYSKGSLFYKHNKIINKHEIMTPHHKRTSCKNFSSGLWFPARRKYSFVLFSLKV